MKYQEFLNRKQLVDIPTGLTGDIEISPSLYDFQRDITRWALRRGRAAIFADCGLYKTGMQLEWAKNIPGDVLILAPLAVSHQTVRMGKSNLDLDVNYCRQQSQVKSGRKVITEDINEVLEGK